MSRAQVRQWVTDYLKPPAVAGLNLMLRSQPRDLGGLSFTTGAPGEDSGAIGVVQIEGQTTQVSATNGGGGQRVTTYRVAVQVFHRSMAPDAETAMDEFDAVIDALAGRLEADPSLGLGITTAQQAGLLSAAYESLDTQFGEPESERPDGGWTETWAVVRFPVLMWTQ